MIQAELLSCRLPVISAKKEETQNGLLFRFVRVSSSRIQATRKEFNAVFLVFVFADFDA